MTLQLWRVDVELSTTTEYLILAPTKEQAEQDAAELAADDDHIYYEDYWAQTVTPAQVRDHDSVWTGGPEGHYLDAAELASYLRDQIREGNFVPPEIPGQLAIDGSVAT